MSSKGFWDKGDYYDGRNVTCASCQVTSQGPTPIDDHQCKCGRWLSGGRRYLELELPNVPVP